MLLAGVKPHLPILISASLVPLELLFLKAGSCAVDVRLYQVPVISNLLFLGFRTQPRVAASVSCVSNPEVSLTSAWHV